MSNVSQPEITIVVVNLQKISNHSISADKLFIVIDVSFSVQLNKCLIYKHSSPIQKMSYQHPNSSTVIFEYDQNEIQKQQQSGTTKSNSNKIHNSNTNKKDDENSPIQITTNIIKVKSTPRIRTRGKINISGGEIMEQPVKKKIKRLVFEEDDDENEDGKEDKDSQSLSNRQTKNTKTIEQNEMEEYDIQKNVPNFNQNQDFQIQLYARQKSEIKRQQKIQPQSVIPCKAKRQLGNSDEDKDKDEGEEQIKEKQQEYESQQQQEYEQYIRKQKQAKIQTKIQRQPSLSINFASEQLQTFLHTPINPKYQFQCIVEINEGFFGIGNRYHLKQKFQNKILISAKKQLMSFNPKLILSMNKDNHSRRHRDFIGVLEGNFGGNQWKLECPVVPNRFNQGQVCEDMRDLLIARYDTSVMGSKSLRQMRAYIIDPSLPKHKQKQLQIQPQITKKSPKITCLQTAKPILQKGRYMLDFKGLAKIPSNKNFIMLTKQGIQCLIFAKQSEEIYVMNIRYPLTLVQGFSLCLASLNSKLFVN